MNVVSSISVYKAKEAIDFYKDVFGATVKGEIVMMNDMPGYEDKVQYRDLVAHSQVHFGDTVFYINDQLPDFIQEVGRNVQFCLNVYDINSFEKLYKNLKSKATIEREKEEEYWGATSFSAVDPFDIVWHIFLMKGETE